MPGYETKIFSYCSAGVSPAWFIVSPAWFVSTCLKHYFTDAQVIPLGAGIGVFYGKTENFSSYTRSEVDELWFLGIKEVDIYLGAIDFDVSPFQTTVQCE